MKKLALYTLLLLATAGSTAVAAQPAVTGATGEQGNDQTPPEIPDAANPHDSSPNSSGRDPDRQAPTTEDAQPSPFDYNPSEEISEDLSVSFPVDI